MTNSFFLVNMVILNVIVEIIFILDMFYLMSYLCAF